jgi:hypothetical protein
MDDWEVVYGGEDPYGQTAVADAVRRELSGITVADAVLQHVAIELAKQIDAGKNVAGASRELRLCMTALRSGDGALPVADDLDELQAKRDARRKANG